MTGIDLSKKALTILTESIKNKKIKARIIRGDMRKIPFENEFDAVINMFTAFGYLETDNENLKVLRAVAKSLKPGGKFLIDIVNRDWLLANFQPKSWQKSGRLLLLEERIYNTKTHRNTVKIQILDEKGRWHKTAHIVRMYSLKEMKENLNRAGLKVVKVYGDTIGNQKFTRNSRRLVILATK